MRIQISAAIIARDEEAVIGNCIRSLNGLDEIIVLDTGSKDKTPAIATELRAKVYFYRWEDDFAAARNKVLEYCAGSWIFTIDADEVLTTPVTRLRDIVGECYRENCIAVRVADKEKYWRSARLYRAGICHWQGTVHNTLNREPTRIFDDVIIWHYGSVNHDKDPYRSIRLLRESLRRNPRNTRDMFFLGLELVNVGDYDAAVYWLEYYVKISPVNTAYTPEALFQLSTAYRKLNRAALAVESLTNAVAINLEFKAAYEALAVLTGDRKYEELAQKATNAGVLCVRNGMQPPTKEVPAGTRKMQNKDNDND